MYAYVVQLFVQYALFIILMIYVLKCEILDLL